MSDAAKIRPGEVWPRAASDAWLREQLADDATSGGWLAELLTEIDRSARQGQGFEVPPPSREDPPRVLEAPDRPDTFLGLPIIYVDKFERPDTDAAPTPPTTADEWSAWAEDETRRLDAELEAERARQAAIQGDAAASSSCVLCPAPVSAGDPYCDRCRRVLRELKDR